MIVEEYGIAVFSGFEFFHPVNEYDVFKILVRFSEAEVQFPGLHKILVSNVHGIE